MYGLAIVHIDDKSKYLLSDLINKLEQTENKIKQLMESKPEQPFKQLFIFFIIRLSEFSIAAPC